MDNESRMSNKQDIVILILIGTAIVGVFLYLDIDNSLFGILIDQFTLVDFDEVYPRNIVKNAIPIILLEENGDSCKVYGEKFFLITNHSYFVRSQELIDKLQYDHDERTLIIPCDQIPDEKSRLEVWYVTAESEKHSTKYNYWITPWNETLMPDS